MTVKINQSWEEELKKEFNKSYFKTLIQFVDTQYSSVRCFPEKNKIFSAFNNTPYHAVKVVIIGQDPYHGFGQANGLCFSVVENVKHPPSLQNIFKELETDLKIGYPKSGNLEHWAKQGVLLLNSILTVQENQAGSHKNKGWEQFTDAVIEKLSKEREGLIFLLWGGYAKQKGKKIDTTKHWVLESGHPSPLSANRGYWFGNKHFSKTNTYLLKQKKERIKW